MADNEELNLASPRDLLESMGLSVPEDIPATWEDLRVQSQKLGINPEYRKHNAYGSGLVHELPMLFFGNENVGVRLNAYDNSSSFVD